MGARKVLRGGGVSYLIMRVICCLFALLLPPSLLPADEISYPFDGKSLEGWSAKRIQKGENKWRVGIADVSPEDVKRLTLSGQQGELVNLAQARDDSWDLYTAEKYGSCRIELEVMVPKGSNSGIYVMGEYEVQVYDSYGKTGDKLQPGDMGAIYGAQVPKVNAAKPPGEWQRYVIEWQAPQFDKSGKKIGNAKFLKVELNGQVLHENLEMKAPTPGGLTGKEAPSGPLMFQGDHGPVAYRNIKITPRHH